MGQTTRQTVANLVHTHLEDSEGPGLLCVIKDIVHTL